MKQNFINAVSMIALAIVMLCAVFAISRANAGEREKDHDHKTINTIVHDHDDKGKGVVLGIIIACRLNAVRAALFEGRWWTWCGEAKDESR